MLALFLSYKDQILTGRIAVTPLHNVRRHVRLHRVLFLRQRHHIAIHDAVFNNEGEIVYADVDAAVAVSVAVAAEGRGKTLRRIGSGGFCHAMLSPNMFRNVVFVGVDSGTSRALVLGGSVQLMDDVDPKTLDLPAGRG